MEHLSGYPGYRSLRKDMKLPTFRVYYDNGTSYVTNMAVGITLKQARSYFITGDPIVLAEDEKTGLEIKATVIRVEFVED